MQNAYQSPIHWPAIRKKAAAPADIQKTPKAFTHLLYRMSSLFCLLSIYSRLTSCMDSLHLMCKKLYSGIRTAFQPTTYVFFEDIYYPYLESLVNTRASTSAKPLWKYVVDTHTFTSWTAAHTRLPLSYLSIEIVQENKVLYDLTDFLDTMRVYGNSGTPSLHHIVHAWVLSSGICLHPKRNLILRAMNTDAETELVPLYYENPLEAYEDELDEPKDQAKLD